MTARRRIVYVTGSTRSGASTLAGVLSQFGLRVPPPEAVPRAGHLRALSESEWVNGFHDSLLRSADVRVTDARPIAWHLVDRAATEASALDQIAAWLRVQVLAYGDIVITDPGLPWFLELWQRAAASAGAAASSVVVLRSPTESVDTTAAKAGDELLDQVAGWVNLMLGTELTTRATPRTFLHHRHLVDEWDDHVFDAAVALDLPMIDPRNVDAVERVDDFLGPVPHHVEVTWQDVLVPAPLRTLADDTWDALETLTRHDDAGTRAEFDRLRALYPHVYRKVTASPARRIARMVAQDVLSAGVRKSGAAVLWRSPDAGRRVPRRGNHLAW